MRRRKSISPDSRNASPAETSVQCAQIEHELQKLKQKFPQFWNPGYQPTAEEADAYVKYQLLQKGLRKFIQRIEKRAARIVVRVGDIADLFAKEAKQAKKRGHPVRAAIYKTIANRWNRNPSDKSLAELASWLPPLSKFKKWDHNARKAYLTLFVQNQDLSMEQKQFILASLNRRGRPATGTAREVAAEALELHRKGWSWRKIEKKLLPGRNYQKPGQAVRSEVQHLNRVLKRFQISA